MKYIKRRLNKIEESIDNGYYYISYYNIDVTDESPHFHYGDLSFETQKELDEYIINDIRRNPKEKTYVLFDNVGVSYPVDLHEELDGSK